MTDRREKLALRAVPRLGTLERLAKPRLVGLDLGHVVKHGHVACKPAAAVGHRSHSAAHWIQFPVLAPIVPFPAPGLTGPDRLNEVRQMGIRGFSLLKIPPIAPQELAPRISDLIGEAAVGVLDPVVQVGDHHRGVALLDRSDEVAQHFPLLGLALENKVGSQRDPKKGPGIEGERQARAKPQGRAVRDRVLHSQDHRRHPVHRGHGGIHGQPGVLVRGKRAHACRLTTGEDWRQIGCMNVGLIGVARGDAGVGLGPERVSEVDHPGRIDHLD